MSALAKLDKLVIANTRIEHAAEIGQIIRRAFGLGFDDECEDCMGRNAIAAQLSRFPEGQFVALLEEDGRMKVVGTAHTMRLSKAPNPGEWMETIGDLGIANHEPDGEWLYGVEMAVHPGYRRLGIGTALYEARFALCKRLNLRGWYAGGMLMGYPKVADQMSVREYGEKVVRGELVDPTVTMQMRRGFKPVQVIEYYMDEPASGDGAMLIVWENPDYIAVLPGEAHPEATTTKEPA